MSPARAEHVVFVEASWTGAGQAAIDYCGDRGYDATLITRDPDRGHAHGGCEVIGCETNDERLVLEAVEELTARKPVDAVTTTADLYTPQAARCAEHLGLPGNSYAATAAVRNKYAMRVRLEQRCPELNPPFALVHGADEAFAFVERVGYPIVGKPANANDSWNVLRIDSDADLTSYLEIARSWTTNAGGQPIADGVLLEGYIAGTEHSVDTTHYGDGTSDVMAVTGKHLVTGERQFAEIAYYMPVNSADLALLGREVGRALAALSIRTGVAHTECRAQDGVVKILEVHPRLAGDSVGSHMFEMARGASTLEQMIESALGRPRRWSPTRDLGACSWAIPVPATGVFGGLRNEAELRRQEGVARLHVALDPGTYCYAPPRSNQDFIGRLITIAPGAEAAIARAREVAALADIVIQR